MNRYRPGDSGEVYQFPLCCSRQAMRHSALTADMNADGCADGRDVQVFADVVMGG